MNENRWIGAWFIWGGIIIGLMIWHDAHLPNCLALYHNWIPTPEDPIDPFLNCEDSNMASAFMVQAVGIGIMLGLPIFLMAITWIWMKVLGAQ